MVIMQSLSRKKKRNQMDCDITLNDSNSDHNTVEGGLEAEKVALAEYNQSIVVIPGMEYR